MKPLIKDNYQESKRSHDDFRTHYMPRQIKFVAIFAFLNLVLSILGTLIIAPNSANPTQYVILFRTLTGLAVYVLILLFFGAKVIRFSSISNKNRYYECVSVMMVLLFLGWSFMDLCVIALQGREIDLVPVIIMYTICCMFFYFRMEFYILFCIFSIACSTYYVFVVRSGNVNMTSYSNIIFLGAMLSLGGVFNYSIARKEFHLQKEALDLKNELEASNLNLYETNQELLAATELLQESIHNQKIFTASMNHELRSPLNGILGLLQILGSDETLNPEQQEYIERAKDSSKILVQIVNDLLDYSKLEAGEFPIASETFDLRPLCEDAFALISPACEKKGLRYETDIRPDLPCILQGDGIRIGQIMTNLLSNASKYTDHGYIRLSIDIKDDLLMVKVSDSGQGMSSEAQAELFTPFKRFNEQKNRFIQGTGLGLSIVHSLVTQMGGTIGVESEPGKGSTFLVSLPITIVDESVHYADSYKSLIDTEIQLPDLSGKKLLYVDDNKINLTVFKGLLKKTDAMIELIGSGKEGLEASNAQQYDLIFLDHLMPEMDGVDVFRAIRNGDGPNRSTPIVILTANAGIEAEEQYREMGFEAYLSKPVIKEKLYELLQRFFG